MLNYYDRCHCLGCLIHRGFSLDLGLPERFFDDKLDAPIATLRLLRYPAGQRADPAAPGAGTHTDYVSTPHRVAVPERERYSIAFFLDPNPDAPVVPVVLSHGQRAKYPPTTAGAFLQSRLDPTYSHVAPGHVTT